MITSNYKYKPNENVVICILLKFGSVFSRLILGASIIVFGGSENDSPRRYQ